MSDFSRRSFLGTSLASFAAGRLLAEDQPTDSKKASETPKPAEPKKVTDNPAFQPSTLFLTWQRDPTTTMTVQWIGVSGETADTNIQFAKLSEAAEPSSRRSSIARTFGPQ